MNQMLILAIVVGAGLGVAILIYLARKNEVVGAIIAGVAAALGALFLITQLGKNKDEQVVADANKAIANSEAQDEVRTEVAGKIENTIATNNEVIADNNRVIEENNTVLATNKDLIEKARARLKK